MAILGLIRNKKRSEVSSRPEGLGFHLDDRMNQEISGLSGSSRLTSKPRASMEKVAPEQAKGIEPSQKVKELRQFEVEMEQINHAFALVKEIRNSLENSLKELSE